MQRSSRGIISGTTAAFASRGNVKTIRNMFRWPAPAPRAGLRPAGIRSRTVTHPTPAFGEKSFITSCRISYLCVLDQRVSGGHAIMSQTKSCAVDTNHDQHCLSITRLREFLTTWLVCDPARRERHATRDATTRTTRSLWNRATWHLAPELNN